ncbi:RNA polymerase sigma factor [Thermoflavifilum thermophilum]|uniref:RNA polymerase sigma factor, sigma-70 family n=1 Tax=Thermoflavifilum thermophilum TaxID=1393122 RepID=A0A1I7MZ33_9BACT|nr:sigma-70 family RNA polymerase sigma factor [Thermoflavifilum thermophilum]SFV27700.1 RNA polymerase sigma factor, sigma-70 family [Thermoflavifilum thermophilum]
MSSLSVSKKAKDAALLDRLLCHDREALQQIYESCFPMIKALVKKNNGLEEDAEDIFQETLIILLERAQSPDFTLTCRLKTYIYAVSKHLWLKRLESTQRQLPLADGLADWIPVTDDIAQHEERDQAFRNMEAALNQLGEPCRSLLEHYYIMNKSMAEIAEIFGYTNADNAKTQKYKCLMRLKKIFFAYQTNKSGKPFSEP